MLAFFGRNVPSWDDLSDVYVGTIQNANKYG